jgi:hypothetical protein
MSFWTRTLAICLAFVSAEFLPADDLSFTRDVLPILSDNCFHCHGPDENTRQADLRLDTREGLFRQQDGVSIVVPNDLAASELIRRITSNGDDRMPPPDSLRSLTPEQIDVLRRWVESGAVWEGHWSFQPVVQPNVPEGENAIDYFVRLRLQQDGLSPAPPADKERLLRRVTFDLTGLPPTIEELDAFLSDDSPDAYNRVVDRLLASQHYGERMAWDWLDAARYADSNGFQGDSERTMWPWRDWVIKAFNDNMHYDQFTVWQLAGDLLPEPTIEQRLATGFNRNHMINGEGGRIAEENRIEYGFDQVETMGTVWLGLTLQCCRCHDHKFDPLSRREYYELFAYFNQTPVDGGGGDPQQPPNLIIGSPEQEAERERLHRETEAAQTAVVQLEATVLEQLSRLTGEAAEEFASIRETLAVPILDRNDEQWAALEGFGGKFTAEYGEFIRDFRAKRGERDNQLNSLPRVMVMQDMDQPRATFMLNRGLYNQPGEEVTAGTPSILPDLPHDAVANRLSLANWLVDPANPLTARVTVNRYWQMFFGTGLVKTTENFGSQGERPSHPELLDWLAADFVKSGWNVKHLVRTIVTSETYRQSSTASPEAIANDPENRLLARGPRSRMSSWMLRDHALAASGLLVDRIGGMPVYPYQPDGVWAEATFGGKSYPQSHGEDLYRRGLYTFWRRIVGPTMFFDESKRQTCSVRTTLTNTPLHALTTLNDITYVEAARALAQRVMLAAPDDAGRIEMAFRLATSRRPTERESEILLGRLAELRSQYAADPDQAAQLLTVGESKRDESLDPMEHAAFTGVCSLILNLDEALSH